MKSVEVVDLFGDTVVIELSEAKGPRKPTKPNGYAAVPGSGPTGETCKSCEFAVGVGGHARTYYKCEKRQHLWTGGPGSDIRLRSPACSYWEREIPRK